MTNRDIKKVYGIEPISSPNMDKAIESWQKLTNGNPTWATDDIKTIKFSNTIARELATLITLNIDVKVVGREQEVLQQALDKGFLNRAQEILERVIRTGGLMAKWNGTGIEYLGPERFMPIATDSAGNITSVVFLSFYRQGKHFYSRAEWHRYEGDQYKISNRAFVSENQDDLGTETPLSATRWADIEQETAITGLEHPLYVYLKSPYSNTIDETSPLGVSIFSECEAELEWLDIAMSRLGRAVEDSAAVLFVDETVLKTGRQMGIKIPRYVQGLGSSVNMARETIQQWSPDMQIQARKEAINFYLSIISYKCGFDPGYFVFDGQHITVATATQVEATERRTINTVLSYRNLLDRPASNGDGRVGFLHDLVYIIDAMRAAGGGSRGTYGAYEIYADFKDLTENEEENKNFDKILTDGGYMAKWRFLVRHLGMTEEEAKEAVKEAIEEARAESAGGLFDEE